MPHEEHHRIAILGSGFAGLGMAIRLRQSGVEDFVVLERADGLGGVWRDNRYPGCACDVQSHLYSFSFAPNPDWSRSYSPQPEILGYLRECAERFGLAPHLRFEHDVEQARWDDERRLWVLDTTRGRFTADLFVAAAGGLSTPAVPDLPGLESFAGTVVHSARWDPALDLAGKRVAVVGTGASAIQIVPAIQPEVARLTVLQRTPPWILPRNDRPIPAWRRRLYTALPFVHRIARALLYVAREVTALGFMHPWLLRRAQRLAVRHLERSVPDPVLRAKLTPRYTMGCKRILLSDDYLPALSRPNVEVVTERIREIRPHSVVTADGVEREVDALVFGTGFHVTDMPIAERIRGRGGRTLADEWRGSPRAYLGTTVAGYPSLFLLQGPNTGLGHTSVILMMESQIEHVLGAIRHLDRTGAVAVEPRGDLQERFVRDIDAKMASTVWLQGGCASWYLDETGRNSTLWPGFTFTFARLVSRFDPSAYRTLGPARAAERAPTAEAAAVPPRRAAADSSAQS